LGRSRSERSRADVRTLPHYDFPLAVTVKGTEGGEVRVEFHCKLCGGFLLSVDDNPTESSLASCKACGAHLGSLAGIRVYAAQVARAAGYAVWLTDPATWRAEDGEPAISPEK